MKHQIVVPIYGWDRWPEVVEYAVARGIDLQDAIRELANCGLSHQQGTVDGSRHG
jgi:hypothetical protein